MKAIYWVETIPDHIQTQGVNIKQFLQSNLLDHRKEYEALTFHEMMFLCIDCSQSKWKIVDAIIEMNKQGLIPLLP